MPEDELTLYAYELEDASDMPIAPAAAGRAWMDETRDRFADRCLPLRIANQCGWWISNPQAFRACWTGGDEVEDLKVEYEDEPARPRAVSHFGVGVLTFRIPYLIRTPPGINLWVKGPANWIKDGAQALEGIVETDWATATFTMNWKLTRPGHEVRFDRGEPICMIVPLPRGQMERLRPRLASLASDPQLEEEVRAWKSSRAEFLKTRPDSGPRSWQKHYHQGRSITGNEFAEHQRKLDLKPFTRA